jgi:hypothetical protein
MSPGGDEHNGRRAKWMLKLATVPPRADRSRQRAHVPVLPPLDPVALLDALYLDIADDHLGDPNRALRAFHALLWRAHR